MRLKTNLFGFALVVILANSAAHLQAGLIGIASSNSSLHSAMASVVNLNGDTSSVIGNLASQNLSGFDAIWLVEDLNSGTWTSFLGGSSNVANYVSNGGALFFNDRSEGENVSTTAYLNALGASSLQQIGFTFDDTSISPPGGTLLTNGPNGTLNNSSLDGGDSSFHGALTKSSILARGGTALIERASNPNAVGAFSYGLGSGSILYDRSPLGFFLVRQDRTARSNYRNIYAPNALAYVQSLSGPAVQPVPEPSSFAIFGLSAVGIAGLRRRRQRPTV